MTYGRPFATGHIGCGPRPLQGVEEVPMLLDGLVAIVTGAGSGIGRGIALKLAEEGAAVVVNGVNLPNEEETVRMIEAEGGRAIPVVADVRVKAEVEAMVARAVEAFGKVDILVNNAGIRRPAGILNMSERDWDDVIAVHLKGAFLCTQAAARLMRKNGYGRVINISSEGALCGEIGMANYIAAKAGLFGFTMTVALEFARWVRKEGGDLTCNLLMPGFNETRMMAEVPPQRREELLRLVPLGRPSDPREDIGNAVAFLASRKASYITGVKFSVGGGINMCLAS